jgi:RNA polymerase sigma-70 factor, ECF subfamily
VLNRLAPATAPRSPDADEAELLARVASGEHGVALRALYRRYEGRLYGVGLRLLGDPGLAEELVQETFLRLWKAAGRFDPERGCVRALVFTIARRVAVDLRRRPSSRAFAGEPPELAMSEPAFDQIVLSVTVRDAMNALSPAHREVLELAYDHDLTLADVAARLRIPHGTAKTRAWHALKALRAALEERGWDG